MRNQNLVDVSGGQEVGDAKFYENDIWYVRKFIDRDPNLHTEKGISYIKNKLGFVRKFERIYPHPHDGKGFSSGIGPLKGLWLTDKIGT